MSASAPDTEQGQVGDEAVEKPPTNSRGTTTPDLASLLKVLKVDVPQFNGQNVHNWVYTIEKFFSLHSIPSELRLQVVAFHLDGEAASWYQWICKSIFGPPFMMTRWVEFPSLLR